MTAPAAHVREVEGGCQLDVLVAPRASRARIGPLIGDRLKVAVAAPPVDGAANAALTEVIARALGVARSQVSVLRGERSRRKTLVIAGVTRAALEALGR